MIAICYIFLLSVLSSNIHFGHTDEGDCLKQPADILFLVDRSGSVGEESFRKCLDFIVEVSKYFEIGNDHVKFSIFTMEATRAGFYFNQSNTKKQFIDLIQKIRNGELNFNIGDSFESSLIHAQNSVFNKSNGARDFAHKIIVAITDGYISVGTGPKTLQDDDVIMFGIGASDRFVNNNTISKIASSPKHVYILNNFDFVSHVTQSLINTSCSEMQKNPCESGKCVNATSCIWTGQANYTCVCIPGFTGKHCDIDINECNSLPCQNGGTCEDKLNAYTCHCPKLFSGVNCEKDQCSLRPMDIIFLMDGSYSVDTSHFDQQKHFIKQVLQNLTIGPDDVLVGAVTFSTNTDVSFSFKSPFDVTQMKTAIDSVHFMNGVSFLGKAFQTVENMLQIESRSRSKKIVVLLFDGMMSDPTEAKRMADKLINQFGAQIFVIAFGNDFYHEKAVELTGGVRENVLIHNQPIKFLNRLVYERSHTECFDCKRINDKDMIFLVDCSNDVRELHLTDTIPTKLRQIVTSFPIGQHDVQYSLITYHVTAELKFNLTRFGQSDLESIKSYVSRFKKSEEKGNMTSGLREALVQFTNFNSTNRKKQLVIISPFKSNLDDQSKKVLADLEELGVEIITFALDCVDELSCNCKQVASSVGNTYYFGDTFNDSIDTLISNMQETSCKKR